MTVIKRREGWPTPCAHDAMAQSGKPHGWQRNGKELQRNLNDLVVRMAYPTPTAKDANGPWHTTHSPSLNVVVTTYPRPCASARPCEGSVRLMRKLVDRGTLTCAEANAMNGRDIRLKQGKLSRFDTPTVHGDGGSGRNGAMPKYGQLNPDWEEWLMAWPVGWTDLETPNIRLVWLDPSIDPADYGEIPRITNRRDNRPARVKEIGNGQFPLTAAVAFHWGLCVLEIVP